MIVKGTVPFELGCSGLHFQYPYHLTPTTTHICLLLGFWKGKTWEAFLKVLSAANTTAWFGYQSSPNKGQSSEDTFWFVERKGTEVSPGAKKHSVWVSQGKKGREERAVGAWRLLPPTLRAAADTKAAGPALETIPRWPAACAAHTDRQQGPHSWPGAVQLHPRRVMAGRQEHAWANWHPPTA